MSTRVTQGSWYWPTQMERVIGSNAARSWAPSRSAMACGFAQASTSRVTAFRPQMPPAGRPGSCGPEMNHTRPSPTANGRKL